MQRPTGREFMLCRPTAADRSLLPVTRNMILILSKQSMKGTRRSVCLSMCRRIISRTTTTQKRLLSNGEATQIFCFQIGLTTLYIRQPLTILPKCSNTSAAKASKQITKEPMCFCTWAFCYQQSVILPCSL